MKKPANVKICLNAMVGNEEATITRMLNSVADHIDYYVIQCNGKNDNTRQIIDTFFSERGIPGFTYEIDWDYPGWNRDHTLQRALKANHGCDWILRMDADEQLLVEDDFDWTIFEDTRIQSFNIVADPGDSVYFRTWLWNAKLPWFFTHDRRHETIHLPEVGENFQRVSLPKGFRHIITNDGETWYAPMKFLKDALELEMDKVTTSKVLEDDYHLFYIGKSYSDVYQDYRQFPFGKDHSLEFARRAIFYFDMYLKKVHSFDHKPEPLYQDEQGYYAMISKADAHRFIGQYDEALLSYKRAEAFSPERSEHLEKMSDMLESLGQWDEMIESTSKMLVRRNPFPTRFFLIHNSAYPDTSDLPYWMFAKAMKGARKTLQQTTSALLSINPSTPASIIDQISKSDLFNESNPLNLTSVFGVTQ